jgi:hypothetical protein
MTAPKAPEISTDPSDGEIGDAKAVESPLSAPKSLAEQVIDTLAAGLEANFDEWRKAAPDPAVEAGWDDARTLTGVFIVELCLSVKKGTRSFPRGIRIRGARIEGKIDLSTASVDTLLLLERCRIDGDVMLRDSSTRLVNLSGTRVLGHVSADRLRSSAGVYLRDWKEPENDSPRTVTAKPSPFVCEGSIRLTAAVIEGDLDCNGARILNERPKKTTPKSGEDFALRCDRMKVAGSVFLERFKTRGPVRLLDAKVGANVVVDSATLSGTGDSRAALFADNARIEGSLVLRNWNVPPTGQISLRNASAGVLQLGAKDSTWPDERTVLAQGFRYGTLESNGQVSLDLCEMWLGRLSVDPFTPQPFEKCAQVLRENGLADDAKRIGIQRRRVQRKLRKRPALTARRLPSWIANRWHAFVDVFLDWTIGYGYRPGRSVAYLAGIALIGTILFGYAQLTDAMIPADNAVAKAYRANPASLPPGYPPLVSPVYSLDVLLPIIDFQQDSKWRPDRAARMTWLGIQHVPIGWIVIVWSWIQIALGWALSTLLVGSVTGLIRKE